MSAEAPAPLEPSPPANRGLMIAAIALTALLIGLALYVAFGSTGGEPDPNASSPSASAPPTTPVASPTPSPSASGGKDGGLNPSPGAGGLEPDLSECGTAEVPQMTSSGLLNLTDGQRFACLRLASSELVKVGVVSSHAGTGSQPDLFLILSEYLQDGSVVPVIGINDVFGTDPEINAPLGKGTYLVDVQAVTGSTGAYQLYFNIDLAMIRTGEVGDSWTGYSVESCSDDSVLFMEPGQTLDVGTVTHSYICTYLPADTWLIVSASTNDATQDLTLEIIGFDEAGGPERYLFNDDDPRSLGSSDPVVQGPLPAGNYIIAVEQYGGTTAQNFTVEVLTGN